MDEILEKRYSEILAGIDPSFLDPKAAEVRRLSTPFLVSGPEDPDARRIMVIGREFGGKGWIVPHEGDGAAAYVTKALSKHRNFFDKWIEKGPDRGRTFFNFMRDLAKSFGAEGLIYSNLLCIDSRGKAPTKSKYFPEIKDLSKRLLDVQIDHFKPDVIIFANGTSGEQIRARREFFPMKGRERVFVSRRTWEEVGIQRGQLEEFELYGKFLCYRIQHPSAQSKASMAARRHLLEVLAQTLPQERLVTASVTGAGGSLTSHTNHETTRTDKARSVAPGTGTFSPQA
ncbi:MULTISPECIES: hypothetical protein [Paraburkholderia]|uniref:hypothetical protein n=1 Tax=Paraburkholderia TaxID=1822464 RepID=UPI00296B3929|nr:hypothetical protein [Paraburkholderia terrae]MDW3663955.1 hypothetical protein [Paraburkholderia terrae]